MNNLSVVLVALSMMLGLSASAIAFQCPSDVAKIDEALESADLTDEQEQEVMTLRNEGERLHTEGSHQEAVDTLAEAKQILGIE